jgi:hypothetical protein
LHRYTSPQSQLVITALLTSVEIVINVSWLVYEPPSVTHSFPTRESRLLICEGLESYSYMVGLLYPFILIGNILLHAVNIVRSQECVSSRDEWTLFPLIKTVIIASFATTSLRVYITQATSLHVSALTSHHQVSTNITH